MPAHARTHARTQQLMLLLLVRAHARTACVL
jgi:hypothetical protein